MMINRMVPKNRFLSKPSFPCITACPARRNAGAILFDLLNRMIASSPTITQDTILGKNKCDSSKAMDTSNKDRNWFSI